MNPRDILNFLRSPTGALILFLILMGVAFGLVMGFKGKPEKPISPLAKNEQPQVVESVKRELTEFHPPTEEEAKPVPPVATDKKPKEKPKLPPISLLPATAEPTTEKPLSADYTPFGRMVRCQLVITVDSSSIQTPIIGLVTEDVWHQGRRIIPVGTEVHGNARVDRVRERIASSGNWTLVWPSGEEMSVSGLALDREQEADQEGWGITDGSAGLRGYLIKSDDLAEIKLFAATFLSGAADALTEKQSTIFGTQTTPTLQNAPFQGAHDVLNVYAQQVLQSIQRDGFYVRVPAGKQFYLYLTQPLDRAEARVGGTRKPMQQQEQDAEESPVQTGRNREFQPRPLPYPNVPSGNPAFSLPTQPAIRP